jgi:hypothetical protein
MPQRWILIDRGCEREVPRILINAEIRCLEQLLQQDDVGARRRSATHQDLSPFDIRRSVG